MPLERVRIDDVRCIERADLLLDARCNYVFGPNGAGKTSLLESIYLLGRGRSFRTRQTARLVRRGAGGLSVFGEVAARGRRRRVGVGFGAGQLDIRIDAQGGLGTAKLAAVIPVYVIDPRLHLLIEAGPSERRRFVDWGVFHVEHDYLTEWRQYRRVLGQRNAALKAGAAGRSLRIWTDGLSAVGARVDSARRRYVDALAERVGGLAERLLGTRLEVAYRPGWRRGLTLEEALDESRDRDAALGSTQVGPHRGDLEIRLEAARVRDAASRGQQKLVAAAMVLAQVGLFEASTGERGVLLLDDPGAELDAGAVARLMREVGKLKAQRVITGLSETVLSPPAGAPVFHVERGVFRRVS